MSFKFQSDSINTTSQISTRSPVSTLNSNLILLILALATLLILATYFKFQSDSINTQSCYWFRSLQQCSLNSNLILLIQLWRWNLNGLGYSLNSNLILLILIKILFRKDVQTTLNSNLILLIRRFSWLHCRFSSYFKFQSDSINTMVTPHRRIWSTVL